MSARQPNFWPAPGKLNLMLRIVGRRDDGYHLLQTVFQFLDFGDRLAFRVRDDGRLLRVAGPPGVPESEDLTLRAARLLQQYTGCPQGADITIDKRLPMGGGLGGGSSDAATALVALNHLWGAGLGLNRMARLGLELGADVPVFVRGQAAWAEGVGERLSPIELPNPWYLVLIPSCRVATAEVFADPELTRDSPRIKIRDFFDGGVHNDCQAVVCKRYPEIADALDWLGRFGEAQLTGTGACIFAAFREEQEARQVQELVPPPWEGLVARGLNLSPLRRILVAPGGSSAEAGLRSHG
jgi:4-diphosphocytidyl-2-C-methyl-D-erythritol kinase